jgi:hypothetical protein
LTYRLSMNSGLLARLRLVHLGAMPRVMVLLSGARQSTQAAKRVDMVCLKISDITNFLR